MQTLEKIAHAPMPFTSGGQTITDRINAAKHSLAGSQLGKTICKATTEELMAPKKKHLDYLLHCTNEPNVSIPSMANLLIERTQNPNWVVVYKALITIHNLMCYGNERFSQYLASCNTTFNLTNFVDKSSLANGAIAAGYDMSTHVRRYGKYISEKIHTYRLCAFDFCKVKRGRDDGLLRTLHTDKLLKTMPILQTQIDALLEFQVTSSELNNGVINCSFILLFRDLIRLFACYNDGVINLLEKYFDMNKKQCREALDLYKGFLSRLDRVSAFLSIAESVGIERGEVPDLTRAPASLLEALESHLYHLEGGRGPPPVSSAQQIVSQQIYSAQQQANIFQQQMYQSAAGGGYGGASVDEMAKQRYLEEEKERLRQYEDQRRRQLEQQGAPTSSSNGPPPSNPFGSSSVQPPPPTNAADLLFFDTPPNNKGGAGPQPTQQIDPSNPFAIVAEINNRSQPAPPGANPFLGGGFGGPPPPGAMNPFGLGQSAAAPNPYGYVPPNAYYGGTPQPQQQQYWPPQNVPQSGGGGPLGIYSQTPFSGTDGSYTAPSALQQNMEQSATAPPPHRPPPPHQQPPNQQFIAQWPQSTTAPPTATMTNGNGVSKNGGGGGGNMDAALSNLVGNLAISSQSQQQYGQPGAGQWPAGNSNPFGAPTYATSSTSANNPF